MTLLNLRPERTAKVRAPRKPVHDCIGNCGRKAAAWHPKDAMCGPCRLTLPLPEYERPEQPVIDPADIPF